MLRFMLPHKQFHLHSPPFISAWPPSSLPPPTTHILLLQNISIRIAGKSAARNKTTSRSFPVIVQFITSSVRQLTNLQIKVTTSFKLCISWEALVKKIKAEQKFSKFLFKRNVKKFFVIPLSQVSHSVCYILM